MNPKVRSRKKERKGKGYSIKEVVEADVDWRDFKRMDIRVDPRRKTVYPKNVQDLKVIKKELKPVKDQHKKPKKAVKKAEPKAEVKE